jgi:hypothetical protein
MSNDVLISVGRVTAQDVSVIVGQPTPWLQVVQAVASIATTVGVLIALYVAAIREPRKAAEERRHHMAQMNALRRAERERVAAQARKVVPYCVRTPMFGDSWWAVRIDNASNALTRLLSVDVKAVDGNGREVPCGCQRANDNSPVDRYVHTALSESSTRLAPSFKQAIRDAMTGHFVKQWPGTLPPNQHAVMAYTTRDPDYTLRISIDYEDEAGYQWRRTDASQPRRRDESEGITPAVDA